MALGLSVELGFRVGIKRRKNWPDDDIGAGIIVRGRLSLFALVLSSVMYVIVDFDRPRDGFVRVSEASMLALINGMELKLKQDAAHNQNL